MFFALAATVVPLLLPVGWSVSPQWDDNARSRPIVVTGDRTVVALAHADRAEFSDTALRWSPSRALTAFTKAAVPGDPSGEAQRRAIGIAAASQSVIVNTASSFTGNHDGYEIDAQTWDGDTAREIAWPVGSDYTHNATYVDAVDDTGDLVATPSMQNAWSSSAREAPAHNFLIVGAQSRDLGVGVPTALAGTWISGFDMDTRSFANTALRWRDGRRETLGDGRAFSVNRAGLTVGETTAGGLSHAVAWTASGDARDILPPSVFSAAYAVADDGTVVGTLLAVDQQHYAFRLRNGVRRRLDDLPHPPGWHFASAFAIAADGTIAGIGTYRDFAAIFLYRD